MDYKIDIVEAKGFTLKKAYKNEQDIEGVLMPLLNCIIVFVAIDAEAEKVLVSISGKHKLVSFKELANSNDLLRLIRPYSFFGKGGDLEYLINFWRLNYYNRLEKGEALKLKVLEGFQGRFKSDEADFWVCGDKIVSYKGELIGQYKQIYNFEINQTIYHVDNTLLSPELTIQTKDKHLHFIKDKTADDFIEDYLQIYKNHDLLYVTLGWFASCMYMQEVMDCVGAERFPMLAISGMTATGKTSLISMLMNFWGGRIIPSDYTMTSQFVELKELSQVSHMPIWRDEYRSSVGKSKEKESLLRSLYNRSTVSKGMSNQNSKIYVLTGTLLLSGEDMVLDPAIRRRFIYFLLEEKDKLSVADWNKAVLWCEEVLPLFWWLALRQGFDRGRFRIWYLEARQKITTQNDKAEEAVCYGALGAVFGDKIARMAIDNNAMSKSKNQHSSLERSSIVEQLFDFINDEMSYLFKYKTFNNFINAPEIMSYVSGNTSGKLKIKLGPLIKLALIKGFHELTTLSPASLTMAVTTQLNAQAGRFSVGGAKSRGAIIDLTTIPKDHAIQYFVMNFNESYKNWMGELTPMEKDKIEAENNDFRDFTIQT